MWTRFDEMKIQNTKPRVITAKTRDMHEKEGNSDGGSTACLHNKHSKGKSIEFIIGTK